MYEVKKEDFKIEFLKNIILESEEKLLEYLDKLKKQSGNIN